MDALILTAGIEEWCAERVRARFDADGRCTVGSSKTDDLPRIIPENKPNLVLLGDLGQSAENQISLIRDIRSKDRRLPIIVVNRVSSEERAVAALRAGVKDYFKRPIPYGQLYKRINYFLGVRENHRPANGGRPDHNAPVMVGQSDVMKTIKSYLRRVAPADSTVMITGETGTGKELAAALIHQHSRRSRGPFVSVNCAALPENLVESELFGFTRGAFTGASAAKKGKFELASGGTLFLDEIGDMSALSQAKILRCIENQKVYPLGADKAVNVDVRIVAATNQDLEMLIEGGAFRPDLYYRLNVARIQLPPLRERKEDIPQLISAGIERLNRQFNTAIQGVSTEVMTSLMMHAWPGNIRELNNLMESAFINCRRQRIDFIDLPAAFTKSLQFVDGSPTNDRDKLLTALAASDWNKTLAAKKLHWSRMRVYRTLKRYALPTKA